METRYKTISLLSGVMSLDLGIEYTGRFDILACVDMEKPFCDTIRLNQRAGRLSEKIRVFESGIWHLSPETFMENCGLAPGELDLLIGGQPCQIFNTAGRRGPTQDPRGMLLWGFLAYVEALQRKFFLIENVLGLVSAVLKHPPIALRQEHGGDLLEEEKYSFRSQAIGG